MASALVNKIGMSPENFLDCPPTAKYPSYGWLSPRISFSRDFPGEDAPPQPPPPTSSSYKPAAKLPEKTSMENKESDPEPPCNDFVDFEFRLEDPVNMLPADELFSDGKLVPTQLSSVRPLTSSASEEDAVLEVRSPETPKLRRRGEISPTDPYLFSPKAPRCSSRWKELLGLKKLYQNSTKQQTTEHPKTTSSTNKSIKYLLQKSYKSSLDSSLSLPLLREGGDSSESVSISSSRISLSSSSSGHEHDDLPRLSLDSEKPRASSSQRSCSNVNGNVNLNIHRVRVAKQRALSAENAVAMRVGRSPIRRPPESGIRGVSVDSPRMNSSGKIVFHSLERSSSSPSSFNGGPKYKHRGMERSYSASIRVTPVLNVPVCSLRSGSKSGVVFGFPLFSSQQKRERDGGAGSCSNNGNATVNRAQQSNVKNHRPDRS